MYSYNAKKRWATHQILSQKEYEKLARMDAALHLIGSSYVIADYYMNNQGLYVIIDGVGTKYEKGYQLLDNNEGIMIFRYRYSK